MVLTTCGSLRVDRFRLGGSFSGLSLLGVSVSWLPRKGGHELRRAEVINTQLVRL